MCRRSSYLTQDALLYRHQILRMLRPGMCPKITYVRSDCPLNHVSQFLATEAFCLGRAMGRYRPHMAHRPHRHLSHHPPRHLRDARSEILVALLANRVVPYHDHHGHLCLLRRRARRESFFN